LIVVTHDRSAIPADCRALGFPTERDGKVEPPGAYDGTVEAIEQKLRNDAVRLGGNIVLLPLSKPGDVLRDVSVDCDRCKIAMAIAGTVYECPKPEAVGPRPR
jgi:hypothetical protein